MKKLFTMFLCFLLCGGFVLFASAREPVKVFLNGTELSIPAEYGQPFYDGAGRVQIPMRYIIEKCGFSVRWNNQSKTAVVSGPDGDVTLTIGSKVMNTPRGTVVMDTAAEMRAKRTYIPLRFVLETLGCTVDWKQELGTDCVKITRGFIKPETLTARQISNQVSPAVFYMEVLEDDVKKASGSGFFINGQGVAVTNYHVLKCSTSATVAVTDGSVYAVERILYYNEEQDIAVIKVSNQPTSGCGVTVFPYVKLGDSDDIANGDRVYAIGSPEGFQNSISDGIISNKNRTLEDSKQTYIQMTAPISHGSSGGALVNDLGEAIGITNASWVDGQSLNFAIPINALKNIDVQSIGIPYRQVYEEEFGKSLKQTTVDFSERICKENESGYGTSTLPIESGDTYIGTFGNYADMDSYTFYTPVPVYATVISGGAASHNYDSAMDTLAMKNAGMDWNTYVQKLFRMSLGHKDGSEAVKTEYTYDGGENPVAVIDRVKIPAGRYQISVCQTLNHTDAWDSRQYFVYLCLE